MMQRIFQVLLAILVLASVGVLFVGRAQKTAREPGPVAVPASAAQVLYLHGTFRCTTCNSIEEQARRVIAMDFAPQLRSQELSWDSWNIDKAEYAHYGEDFALTSASLVLTDGRGAEGQWRILSDTWSLVNDSLAFADYVRHETQAFLRALK